MTPITSPHRVELAQDEEYQTWWVLKEINDLVKMAQSRRPFLRETTLQALRLTGALLDVDLKTPMAVDEQVPF